MIKQHLKFDRQCHDGITEGCAVPPPPADAALFHQQPRWLAYLQGPPSGTPTIDEPPASGGCRVVLPFLIADIAHSTTLLDDTPPETSVRLHRQLIDTALAIGGDYGARLIESCGDSVFIIIPPAAAPDGMNLYQRRRWAARATQALATRLAALELRVDPIRANLRCAASIGEVYAGRPEGDARMIVKGAPVNRCGKQLEFAEIGRASIAAPLWQAARESDQQDGWRSAHKRQRSPDCTRRRFSVATA